ncbi:MAG TPA: hypothetical protein VF787_14985 [Thermoanaerobaculia bacterium]
MRKVKLLVLVFIVALILTPAAFAQSVDLLTEKSGPAEAPDGSDVTYIVTVTNLGPDPAASVELNDPIPAGMTFVSYTQDTGPTFACTTPTVGTNGLVQCTIATLAAGDSAQFSFVFNITSGTPEGTTFTNIATTTSATPDDNEENNSGVASTSTPPPPQAELFVQKVGPSASGADSDVTYTITVGNNGMDDADFVNWEDTLPGTMTFVSLTQNSGPTFSCTNPGAGNGGTITCSINPLPTGTTATFTLVGHIPAGTPSGTEFTNDAEISSETFDPNDNNNTTTTTLIVSAVDIAVTKTGDATVNAGDNITYTITISNSGPDIANASVFDTIPADTTFVSLMQNSGPSASCATPAPGAIGDVICTMTLGSGQSSVFTLVVEAGDTNFVTNTATGSTTEADTNPMNDEATANTTVVASADLSITKNGPATITAGNDITYTITLTNLGVSTADAVTLSDTLPAGTTFVSQTQNSGPALDCTTPPVGGTGAITCTVPTLAPGDTATLTFVFNVSSAAAAGGTISNTATVTSTTSDPSTGNNSSTSNATVATSADVSVVKSGPSGAQPGGNITYNVTVSNLGPSDAANVSLSDTVPAGTTFVSSTQNTGPTFSCATPPVGGTGNITCTIATLADGVTATFTFVVQVSNAATIGTVITNTATVTATTPDSNTGNNSSTTNATVAALADVVVTKTGEPGARAGQTTSYEITVTNNGPTDAMTVQLSDTLPADTTFVSFTQNSGPTFACATPAVGGTGTVTCTIATLANGATATFTLTIAIDADATGSISNTASVSSANDPSAGNDSSTAIVTLAAANVPTLSVWGLMFLAAALGMIVVFRR